MGLNIAITSKYNPFTYEDYIKPLEGYWEDYDKAEEDLDKLTTDVATMRSIIGSMSEGTEKNKYKDYLDALDAQAKNLSSTGLTSANTKALKNLKNQYAELMPRLALAEEARRKDAATLREINDSGEYFKFSDTYLRNVVEYLDGKLPSYRLGINKADLGKTATEAARAYSSKIFPDATLKEVEEAGEKFIKITQSQGIDAALESVNRNNPQFGHILQLLYDEAGIDELDVSEVQAAKDLINRKFWEGLVYEKRSSFQKKPKDEDPNMDETIIGTTINNEDIVKIPGAGIFVRTKDGSLRKFSKKDLPEEEDEKPSAKEEDDAKNARIYYKENIDGMDIWRNDWYNPERATKELDETWTKNNTDLFNNYKATTVSGDPKARHSTKIITMNMQDLLDRAKVHASDPTDYQKYVQKRPNDMIIFGGGSNVGGKRSELFGDNHFRIIDTTTFFTWLEDPNSKLSDIEKAKIMEDIFTKFQSMPEHNAYKKVISLARDMDKEKLSAAPALSAAVGNTPVQLPSSKNGQPVVKMPD